MISYLIRIPIANILSEEDQRSCGREKRSAPNRSKNYPHPKRTSKDVRNSRQRTIRPSQVEYDNSGFNYDYDYGSDDIEDDKGNQQGSGFFSNLFNWKRNDYHKVGNRFSTTPTPEMPVTVFEPTQDTTKSQGIFHNLLEELGILRKSNNSDSNPTSLTPALPGDESLNTVTTTESTNLSTNDNYTTENIEPYEYDCGSFCGDDYDYYFDTPEEEAEHKNFGGFGAIFSQLRTYLSFASFDKCQKNIAYKIPLDQYCELVRSLETKCFEQSLLEIWNYDENVINSVYQDEIIAEINKYDRSPYFGYAFNYTTLLGGVKTNQSGNVVSAASAMYNMATTVDMDKIVSSSDTKNAGTEFFPLDKENLVWQKEMIRVRYILYFIYKLYRTKNR